MKKIDEEKLKEVMKEALDETTESTEENNEIMVQPVLSNVTVINVKTKNDANNITDNDVKNIVDKIKRVHNYSVLGDNEIGIVVADLSTPEIITKQANNECISKLIDVEELHTLTSNPNLKEDFTNELNFIKAQLLALYEKYEKEFNKIKS